MAAGMAKSIDLSSPKTCCHFLRETRRWVIPMESRISLMRARRCSGSEIVLASVSTIHPRITLTVAHAESPFAIFLAEAGSWQ
jgi:hypothetical protein